MSQRFPRVPMARRVAGFAIDFVAAALLSLLGGRLLIPCFILSWLGLRVILVAKNRGQSLGSWAFDLRVADVKHRATPELIKLLKREAIVGIESLLVLIGLVELSPTNGFLLIAIIPLLADCGFAFADDEYRQAFHDRVAQTVTVQTRRGYSLDLKAKRLFAQARRRMK